MLQMSFDPQRDDHIAITRKYPQKDFGWHCGPNATDYPLIVIEAVRNGVHDPDRYFRAEIGPNMEKLHKRMKQLLAVITDKGKVPIVERDEPHSPITLFAWDTYKDWRNV
jgi:hypothetical protein